MILIALVLSAATADRWVHVGVGPNLYEEYVDTESITRNGDKVILWTRRDLVLDPGTAWTELELDCRMRTETILAYIRDDRRLVSHNMVRPHREASVIPPDSVAERIFNIACR